jgi:3-isopropylmalate/(R)-2-methylmalate dehydratase small subunit
VFESSYPDICERATAGEIIVAGNRFGHGNGHAQGWIGLANRGLVVVAESIQRVAYRTAISVGVPILLTPGLHRRVSTGETLSVNFETGDVVLQSSHRLKFEPLPKSLRRILEAGGTKGWITRQLAEQRSIS